MKKIVFYSILLSLLIAGCSKPELKENKSNARITQQMSNEEMEEAILLFLEKLDKPVYYDDIIEPGEALDYIEASLNYQYGDIDYSYCGNILEVEGNVSLTFNQDGDFTFEEVKNIYEEVKQDWSERFAEINNTDKKPAVFDILAINDTILSYRMVFTYGLINLDDFELPLELAGNWITAGDAMTHVMANHLNSDMATLNWCPNHRQYLSFVGIHDFGMKGPLNANDPNPGDGYIDNWFWYTNASEPGYNLNLDNTQFQFHLTKYFQAVTEYMQNYQPGKHVLMSWIMCDYQQSPINPFPIVEAWHEPRVVYANLFCTQTSVSTL